MIRHLNAEHYTACGVRSGGGLIFVTDKPDRVDCKSCRRTEAFRKAEWARNNAGLQGLIDAANGGRS